VVAGITMFNVLLAMPYEIVTHNIGNVDSIAVALFLAGKRRLSNANATFMFHGVGFDSNLAERLEREESA
jgi:ATP-dependent protease ClpP protease subunit